MYEAIYDVSAWDVERGQVLRMERDAVRCALGRRQLTKAHWCQVLTRKVTINPDWTRHVVVTFQVLRAIGGRGKDDTPDAL